MNGVQLSSLTLLLIGTVIMIYPDILAVLLAVVLIVMGINGLLFGRKLNKVFRIKIDK